MTGSITKYTVASSSRPKWRYRICTGRDAATLKYLYAGKGGYDSKGAAADAMRDHITAIETAANTPAPSRETFGDHVQTWLDDHASQRCTPLTLQRYRALVRYVLVEGEDKPTKLALTPLRELTASHLETALYDLYKRPGKKRAHVSAKTVRHVAGVLSTALKKAFKLSKIDLNPMERVELPAVEKHDARALGPKEIDSLTTTCLDDWTHCFVQIALATGCRRGELLALTWPDVDLKGGAIVISKSLEQTKAGLRVKRPKSNKARTFQLPQSALVALRFQVDRQKEERRLFAADYREDLNLVFCQPGGAYMDPALVSQTIIRRMRKAGIQNASLHTLRHTHASGLLSVGVPLPAVSARLGHANTNITGAIYAHAMPADDQLAADKWDELMTRRPQ